MSEHDAAPTTASGSGTASSQGFGRALALTALAVVPGAGLTRTRSRVLGWLLLAATVAGLGAAAWRIASRGVTDAALSLVTEPATLRAIAVAAIVGGLVWCGSILLTAVQARPATLDRAHTGVLAVVAAALVLAVGAGSVKVAEYATITGDTVAEVFKPAVPVPGATTGTGAVVVEGEDPWAQTPRVNILLLGSDAGVDRTGTRTDSMVVASIDTRTGDTALISLPRNLERAPLPASSPLRGLYPSGIYGRPSCIRAQTNASDRCTLNAIWTEVDQYQSDHPGSYLGEVPGRDETRAVIAGITGLTIDHLVVIDLKGFEQLINAMGGLDVNVKLSANGTRLPIGGSLNEATGTYVGVKGYFKPGLQHLNGYYSLWYARTRAADTDTYRQARQRCVVQAIVQQVNPTAMLGQYPELARIARENIYTDIPAQSLSAFVELVERVQRGRITSVSLALKDGVSSTNPDYALVRRLITTALDPVPAKPTTEATTRPTPEPTGTGTTTPTVTPGVTTAPTASYDVC